MDDRTALSRRLTDLVREVDGVKAVYPSAPVVVATLSAVTQAVGQTFAPKTPVLLAQSPGEAVAERGTQTGSVAVGEEHGDLVVSVTIGVSAGASATQVCRTVYDVIAEHFAEAGAAGPRTITVRVGRIG